MSETIALVLKEKGRYVSTTAGVSMYPMLRDRKDVIILVPPNGRLKKYDVPLYCRKRDGQYVLHRILRVLPDGYVIRGDNCIQSEYDITDDDIIGVLEGFHRGKRYVSCKDNRFYRAYSVIWPKLYPIRFVYWKCKRLAARVLRHIRPPKDTSERE